MDIDGFRGNRYLLAGVVVAALLITGFLAQTFTGQAQTGAVESHSLSMAGAPVAFGGDSAKTRASERKRITTVRMDLVVDDLFSAQTAIDGMVGMYGGWVASTSFDRELGKTGRMTVRVPEGNLSTFLAGVEGRYRVQSQHKNVQDVTDRYTELELELRNKRQELQQLESLLNKTEDVEHLIKIQERMGDLRSRIQYLETQLGDLDKRVQYAEVSLQLEERSLLTSRFELRRAINDAYQGMFRSVELMIVGIGYLLPFAVLFALFYLGRRQWRERNE